MSKSGNTTVDNLLASESHQLREQKIYKIRAPMEALQYVAEMVSTMKRRCLNRA